jgi:hypothetical protein
MYVAGVQASIVQLEEMETYKGELVIITHALAWKQARGFEYLYLASLNTPNFWLR